MLGTIPEISGPGKIWFKIYNFRRGAITAKNGHIG